MSTPLRDAFPMAMQAAQQNGGQVPEPMPPQGGGGGGIPHGPMGGQASGSMNNTLPIQQMTGREDMTAMTRPVGAPMPQQGDFSSGPNFAPSPQQAAQAAAYQQAVRQQQMAAQRAQAEATMRSIAKEETRGQAVAYVAIGMAVVILAVLVTNNKASLPTLTFPT